MSAPAIDSEYDGDDDVFREVLEQESYVDVAKLRELAENGIPPSKRGEVWKYLLGVTKPDKSQEISNDNEQANEYLQLREQSSAAERGGTGAMSDDSTTRKRVRGEIKRVVRSMQGIEPFDDDAATNVMEAVILAYLAHSGDRVFLPAHVHLCVPFVAALGLHESAVFSMFKALLDGLADYWQADAMKARAADFVALFRTLLPELYSHLEAEELEGNQWAMSWLQGLLAKELPLACVLRLWDTYFGLGIRDAWELHMYVCLALLRHFVGSLEELDYSELLAFLQRLPAVNIDQIVTHAKVLRQEVAVRNLV